MAINGKQIDEKVALEALNGNRQLLSDLAIMFVEDSPVLLEDLAAAIANKEVETACRLLHTLRGLSSTFYARPTIELALRLEQEASQGSLATLKNGGVAQLKAAIEDLTRELRASGFVS
jgi:HPt (histidine-containing phosphotransfer) domain-containing protein